MTARNDPRGWYARHRAWLAKLVGPDRATQVLCAHELALWSRVATAHTAFNLALSAHNAWEAGTPLDVVRTRRDAAHYRRARDLGLLPRLPLKLRTMAEQLCGMTEPSGSEPEWIPAAIAAVCAERRRSE